jgi:hypothetical protein
VTSYLKSIPKEEVIDVFNVHKSSEKWMKFFKSGFAKILVDTDRALKN